jgi:hypothetical protein
VNHGEAIKPGCVHGEEISRQDKNWCSIIHLAYPSIRGSLADAYAYPYFCGIIQQIETDCDYE